MRHLSTLALVAASLIATPSLAAVTVYTSAGSVQPSENVQALTDQKGLTVLGFTNQTNTSVTFQSLNSEQLNTKTNGQASFYTDDGSLDALAFYLTNPALGFTEVEFNLFNATANTNSVSLLFNDGTAQSYDLKKGGQNYFAAKATGGTLITRVSFDTNGTGFADLRQVRLGGITTAVPEPATWAMMLLGFALVAGTARQRRRSPAIVSA